MKTFVALLLGLMMFGFTTDQSQKSFLTIQDDYVFFAFKGDATEQELEAARLRLRKEAGIEVRITNQYNDNFNALEVKTEDGFAGKAELGKLNNHLYLSFYRNKKEGANSAFFVGPLTPKALKRHMNP